MDSENKVLTLSSFEQRVMVSSLNGTRNNMIKENIPTEDIDDLLIKVIDAPSEKKRRFCRDER